MPTPERSPSSGMSAARFKRWTRIGLLVLVAIWIAVMFVPRTSGAPSITYGAFLGQVDRGEVRSVAIQNGNGSIKGVRTDGTKFSTQGPSAVIPDADLARLADHNVVRTYEPEPSTWLGTLIIYLLPMLLIVGFLVWMNRGAQRQISGLNSFGRSKARVHDAQKSTTTFADVAGYEAVKQEISEVVDFLREPDRFRAVGARIPKGLLLIGPPGTGKTLFARAVAGEAGVPFLSITASEFLEMFVGVGAARVRDLFETARKQHPCIIFVDEIDAIGRKRGAGLGGGQDEREQTLNQLLAEMDGFEVSEGIVVLAATNRPDILDPALLRAGRFDRQVMIPLPTQTERAQILGVHCNGKQIAPDVDLELVARGTPGMSGADLSNLLNEGALMAVRRGGDTITADDIDAARDRVLMGLRRSSLVLTDEEKRLVAHHEAGHAVMAQILPNADRVHKVTILPMGMALGATQQLPVRDQALHQRPFLEDMLAVQLAGRAAEELCIGVDSTGAQDDLVNATELARRMVREWGMSDRLGHLAWGSNSAVFLGEDLIQTRDYSDETARLIDEATGELLETQADRARRTLEAHRPALEAVAAALLEHETLSGAEVSELVARAEGNDANAAAPSTRVDSTASVT